MEKTFKVVGGKKLQGEINLSGAKNIALKVLIGALLFDSKVVLKNIPRIADILELIHLLKLLCVSVEFENNTVIIDPLTLQKNEVDLLYASKIRVSFLLFAPLLYKFGSAKIPNPGGCRLGARSIDRVIEGLKALGVMVDYNSETGYYDSSLSEKPKGNYEFEKPSHTGTELLVLMSVFGEGVINIKNAGLEPEIDDLINFLNDGGAKITRRGSDIEIVGVEKLVQRVPFTISSDRVEAITYAVLGLATKGDVVISDIEERHIGSFVELVKIANAGVEKMSDSRWRFFYKGPMGSMKIETAPFPGFLTDWQPLLAVLMTQTIGKSVIHETIFENRFSYVSELKKIGADIEYIEYPVENPEIHYHFNFNPENEYLQTIEITGPQELHGGVMAVSDLRAGATLAIGALIANGESYVSGIHHLERGYEDFVQKVRTLGGNIDKV